MAQITRSTKVGGGTVLQSNTLARAADVETDVLTLFTHANNLDTGTEKHTVVSAEGSTTVPLTVNNSTGTQNIANFQDNGTSVLTVADGGIVTVAPAGTTKVVANSSGLTLSNSATIAMGSAKITGLASATATGDAVAYDQVSAILSGYRRPNLTAISATTVDVEVNSGTANTTDIVFPDNTRRSVTENTGSTSKYRRFIITEAAEFTSGTENSGLLSSLSEAANTWYQIYAVKSLINAANFVLVGTTTTPTQANFATLNSAFGTNGWVYLGRIANGDNASATTDIVSFKHVGNLMTFTNVGAGNTFNSNGIRLATTASAATLTWSRSAGTAIPAIPGELNVGLIQINQSPNASGTTVRNDSDTLHYGAGFGTAGIAYRFVHTTLDAGVKVASGDGSAENMDIFLQGFVDPLLGIGFNPLI